MAVLLQFRDQRLPPPSIDIDLQPQIDYIDSKGGDESDIYTLSMPATTDEEDIDEDQPLAAALERPSLGRNGSLGTSWGVKAVGRGFDWRWNNVRSEDEEKKDAGGEEQHVTHDDNGRHGAEVLVKDATAPSGADTDAALRRGSSLTRSPGGGERRHLANGDAPVHPTTTTTASFDPSLSSSSSQHPTSPATSSLLSSPSSPAPLMVRRDVNSHSRPIIAGRSQSMYIVPTASARSSPRLADDSHLPPMGEASSGTFEQRAKAWSRPVSPVRGMTLPRLAMSPSAPSLAGNNDYNSAFSPFSPFMITGGALTTPLTPRSPRLNRSR